MRWFVPFVLVALIGGCQCADSPADKAPASATAQKKEAGARDGAKRRKPKGRRGAGKRRRGQAKVYGAPGDLPTRLVLVPRGEGEEMRTAARLELTLPDGKGQRVPLGGVRGACERADPVQVNDRTALYSVQCTEGDAEVALSVVQVRDALAVFRKNASEEDWRAVRRVRLVKGTRLVADGKAVEAAPAKEAETEAAPAPTGEAASAKEAEAAPAKEAEAEAPEAEGGSEVNE